ncbi:MAG: hypothetical protein IPM34_09315 [Saprospiraceae bacterium]|nr:hypothetical protein [Saprospiraceae bacterium]
MNRLYQLLNLLKDEPGSSFLKFALAKEYENIADLEKAHESYLSILKSDPDYLGLYYHLGKLYETLEKNEKAMIIYRQGISKAQLANDLHALSELKSALLNLELGEL